MRRQPELQQRADVPALRQKLVRPQLLDSQHVRRSGRCMSIAVSQENEANKQAEEEGRPIERGDRTASKKEGRPMGRARGAAMTRRWRLIERVERGGGQKRWAADRAGRERRRRNKEGRPMCGARGTEAKEREAADGA
jgi:hypothetical protein